MKIVVFIKEIPVSNNVKIDPKTNNLIRGDEEGRINPYDKNAIEAALQLKEKHGGTVSVVSMGPSSFQMSLREALAMGVDEAFLLSSREFAGADTLATAYTLAQSVRKIGNVDLMLFGLQAIDADTGQVGPLVAEELNLPQVTSVDEIKTINQEEKTIDLSRTVGYERQVVRTNYPMVISVGDEINEPRYQSPLNIKHAMKKDITIWDEADLDCDPDQIGIPGSPSIVTDTYIPKEAARHVFMLEGSPAEAAQKLLDILREKHIL